MKKVALFAFNGEFMCFIHVLLNGLHLKQNGEEVKIVIEGSATKLIPELSKEGNPMFQLYQQAKEQNLIDGVCRACSAKMEVASVVEKEGLPCAKGTSKTALLYSQTTYSDLDVILTLAVVWCGSAD